MTKRRALLPLAVVLLAAPAMAQVGDIVPDVEPRASGDDWRFNVQLVGHTFFDTDLDNAVGELSLDRTSFRVGASRRLDAKRRLSLQARYTESFYDLGAGAMLGGFPEPFEDLTIASFRATLDTRINESWSWRGTLWTTLGWEDDADLGDAASFGGGATVTFPLTKKILVTTGGFASTRLEDDPLVFPWLELDWRPTERLHLGREGGGMGLGYDWREHLKTYVNFSFTEWQFRLSETGPVPNGVARDDEFAINVGVIYELDEHFTTELFGGVVIRELTLLNQDVELDDVTTDPGGYIAFSLRYTF